MVPLGGCQRRQTRRQTRQQTRRHYAEKHPHQRHTMSGRNENQIPPFHSLPASKYNCFIISNLQKEIALAAHPPVSFELERTADLLQSREPNATEPIIIIVDALWL
jgi:hypothetical protein